MKPLRQYRDALAARFSAYSQRERGLIGAAVVVGIILIGMSVFVDPNLSRSRIEDRLAEQQRNDAQSMDAQLQALRTQLQVDPDAGRKADVARLSAELARVETSLKQLEGGLVAPERMNAVLERLLAGNARVRVLSLKSLAPVNLAEAGTEKNVEKGGAKGNESKEGVSSPAATALGLYRHGVEVRLEGAYGDLHAWLAELERSDEKILWGDVRLQVVEYPHNVLTLTIFTLSTDKAWLAI